MGWSRLAGFLRSRATAKEILASSSLPDLKRRYGHKEKRAEEQQSNAKTLAMRLLTTPHGIVYPKFIIVVDDDIDPFDLQQVMWGISVRFRPERDLVLIPNAPGSTVDPAHLVRGITTKTIIDATRPAYPDIPLADASIVDIPPETAFWTEEILKRRK